jgi:uncharacterized membrane protein YqgA involved in biofilm formation
MLEFVAGKGKLFFVFILPSARHNRCMTGAFLGAFLNALGILLGALFGLVRREPLTLRTQKSCQSALGAFTAFCGLQLVWLNIGGSFTTVLKQLFLAVLAVVLGSLLGKVLGLQKISNQLGRHAAQMLTRAEKNPADRPADGFWAATILFCAAPMGIIGALTDGLGNFFFPLAIKGVMDGLAMTSFVKSLRWPVALAAVPLFMLLSGLTWLAQHQLVGALTNPALLHAFNAAAGLILCAITLLILQVRRVEIANYLPALVVAPLLTHWLG